MLDLVPLRDVATYRSYVNIAQTAGRSSGGVIGGFLTQTIGWRWAFLCQAPLTIAAMVLVAFKLPNTYATTTKTWKTSLKRVDFAGAAAMSCAILCLLLVLDMGGDKIPWSSPVLVSLAILVIFFSVLFCAVEKFWAAEPIFPLYLLANGHVIIFYSVMILCCSTLAGMMMFVPLYFQVTRDVSPTTAGASHLFWATLSALCSLVLTSRSELIPAAEAKLTSQNRSVQDSMRYLWNMLFHRLVAIACLLAWVDLQLADTVSFPWRLRHRSCSCLSVYRACSQC